MNNLLYIAITSGDKFNPTEGAVLATAMAIIGIVFAVLAVFLVLVTIINWKLLTKMGDEGWKALIPIYNTWSLCEGVGLNPHWSWIIVVAPGILAAIPAIGSVAGSVLLIYFQVIYCISLARSFGKSDGFAVLLYFFFPITGFLLFNEEYKGKLACKDYIFEDLLHINNNSNNNTNSSNSSNSNASSGSTTEANVVNETTTNADNNSTNETTTSSGAKFCTDCGAKLEDGAQFCTACGKKLN